MGLIWKDEYSTGVQKVDEQHKVLFRNLNKFEEIIQAGKGAQVIEKMLGFLEQYAQKHFAFEEKYMEHYGCPVAKQNKEAHRRFFMMFEKLRKRFEEEGADELLLEQLHLTLETWLLNHILGIDVQLKSSVEPKDD
ncbi:hypothetical protein CSA56_12290 [candidate division KSB3 bacterium]|uniref:Hemerythrin-like domain-containing protein n=1 Tax=candidate division KSB3 bacterium TaxID=2044937 RepID=A0A2G6KCD7_9BACT|nr:MAG: hypothetical protein CSA56_12290 [candidate division KSB3 bacterium]